MSNTDPFETDENKRKKRGAAFYLTGALALIAAGGVGYWSAISPKLAPEVAVQKSAEPETKAAEQPKPAETQAAAAPEEKVPDPKPVVSAEAEAKVEVTQPQVAEAPKPAEPAEPQVAIATPAPKAAEKPEAQPEAAQPEPPPAVQEPAAKSDPEPEQKSAAATPPESPPAAVTEPDIPSFDTVRVEPTGEALIAGRAKPGTEVTVMLNGTVIGQTTANADGAFVLVPEKPLPPGAGSLTLETKLGDKIITSVNAVAVAVKEQAKGQALVAVVTPDKPAEIIQAPSSTNTSEPSGKVVLDAVDYDDQGNIVFAGRSVPGNTVRIYVDNKLAGEVKSNAEGKWSFDGQSTITAGKHTLRADEIGPDGKVASRVELPFLREEQQKVAIAQTPAAGDETSTTKIGVKTGEQAAVPQRIVIQPGNSLWRLSRVVYGKGKRYTVIYEANKEQIRNPDLIYPGQVFAVPVTP
jgi:nucleoid-associated protein YgaU